MVASNASVQLTPQALQTGFASRLRLGHTSLFISTQPEVREANKRARAKTINYAEVEEDFDDDEEDPTYDSNASAESLSNDEDETPSNASLGSGVASGGPPKPKTETKKLAERSYTVKYTPQQLADIADKEDVLIPMRVALEFDGFRINEYFLWNANETVLTPEAFGSITCHDLDLPSNFGHIFASGIRSQLSEYRQLAAVKLPEDCGIHVAMFLSVHVNQQLMEDKFEWDLGCNFPPEKFAKTVVADLGLSGEFYPAIAHALYEVILRMKRDAIDGHYAPHSVANMAAFEAPAGVRSDAEHLGAEWTPALEMLGVDELEKREIERERNIRRLKRETMRMGGPEIDLSRKRRRRAEASPSGSPFW